MNKNLYKLTTYPYRKRLVGYFSQYGQDKYVDKVLHHLRDGVFVDIGANDGISYSNSYFFEKELAWTGIAVEPSPRAFGELVRNRECQFFNGCISNYDGTTPFWYLSGKPQMLSGIPNNYDVKHKRRIDMTIRQHGGEKEELMLPCLTLNSLLRKYNISRLNFLSIDTEGGEYAILEAFDFNLYVVDVICVENNYHNSCFRDLLGNHGYSLSAITGCDEIYVNRKL